MKTLRLTLLSLFCLTLAACATQPQNTSSQSGNATSAQQSGNGMQGSGAGNGGLSTSTLGGGNGAGANGGTQSQVGNGSGKLSQRTFYFPFDSSQVNQKYLPVLQAHANYLINHASAHVRLEGNTDERGTREYNLALGERRSKSIAQILQLDGAPASQITTVSYGEENPVCTQHDKQCWAKNRRVNLIYTSK